MYVFCIFCFKSMYKLQYVETIFIFGHKKPHNIALYIAFAIDRFHLTS